MKKNADSKQAALRRRKILFGKMPSSVQPLSNKQIKGDNFNCCCSENLASLSFSAKNYFRDTVAYLEEY
jgi:hypothetical protein